MSSTSSSSQDKVASDLHKDELSIKYQVDISEDDSISSNNDRQLSNIILFSDSSSNHIVDVLSMSSESKNIGQVFPRDYESSISSSSSDGDSQEMLSFMATKVEILLWKDGYFSD